MSPKQFENWIKKNFKGESLESFPKDWDPSIEYFHKVGELQYRIPFSRLPTKIREIIEPVAKVTFPKVKGKEVKRKERLKKSVSYKKDLR